MSENQEINESMLFSFKPVLYHEKKGESKFEEGKLDYSNNLLAHQANFSDIFSRNCAKAGLDPNQDILQSFKRRERNKEEVLKFNIGRDFNNSELKILCETMMDYQFPFAFKLIDTKIGTPGLQIISQLLLVK